MTLTTHGIVGGALAVALPQPFGWIAAFLSHYVLDAIPHWDYPLHAFGSGEHLEADIHPQHLLGDVAKIGMDFALGLALPVVFFSGIFVPWYVVLVSAFAAMLPDAFQFFFHVFPREPFITLQKIGVWAHSPEKKFNRTHQLHGVLYQLLLVAIVLIITIHSISP